MADPTLYTYPSPLEGYEHLPPLSADKAADKSLINPPSEKLSRAYEKFIDPLDKTARGGFDVHVYYFQSNPSQLKYARELHERIRREFPEIQIYTFWDRPIGPHPVAMFEVNLHSPAQFGAFIPWLAIWRGPLSVLIHPNTEESGSPQAIEKRNHTQRATWMGDRVPLDLEQFKNIPE